MDDVATRNRRLDEILDALEEHAGDVDFAGRTAQEIRDLIGELADERLAGHADQLEDAEAYALALLWIHRKQPGATLGAVLDAMAPEDDSEAS